MARHATADRTILGTCYAASRRPQRPLKVLDFGGACGTHYRVAKRALPHIPMKWAIVETPAMARRAKELETESLRFFDSIPAAIDWLGDIDLVHSFGALAYCPAPLEQLHELCSAGADTLLWSRMAFSTEGTRRTVQVSRLADNGPGPLPPGFVDQDIAYTCTEIPLADFLATHSNRYRLIWQFGEPMMGFLFTLKES
jgi:putative methyltransferase (TIGR04325 family)